MPRTEQQFKEIRDKTRRQILESALILFAKKGFHGTSMSDIANEAGVSKGLAYNYFKSKREIAQAIFEQMLRIGSNIEKIILNIKDPFAQLKSIIEEGFCYIEENEKYWRLYVGFALQPDILDLVVDFTFEFNEKMVMKIAEIFTTIGIKDPELEARMFETQYDGIVMHYYFDKENYPFEEMKRMFMKKYSREELEKMKS
ncbi:MAG: hypothetical protein A2V66_08535 [Ignavibacteria bacterium RBG_13_36_8]|nr:MAG: hypothetical protein A2V66_08535 [Ignavibacteria bacterium RBG_13_36_8]